MPFFLISVDLLTSQVWDQCIWMCSYVLLHRNIWNIRILHSERVYAWLMVIWSFQNAHFSVETVTVTPRTTHRAVSSLDTKWRWQKATPHVTRAPSSRLGVLTASPPPLPLSRSRSSPPDLWKQAGQSKGRVGAELKGQPPSLVCQSGTDTPHPQHRRCLGHPPVWVCKLVEKGDSGWRAEPNETGWKPVCDPLSGRFYSCFYSWQGSRGNSVITSPPSPALLIHILRLWCVALQGRRSVKTENRVRRGKLVMKIRTFFFFVVFIVLLLHAKCSVSIPVTCKPCSDEEVLMAVCTSDFGKYVHAQTHTRTFKL